MSREISKAESWERVYEAFSEINFTAFDYKTIKQSLIDYIKLYFSESFNDYIESSEFIAILDTVAYVGELLAYRIDMNTHENFIATAERKQSVLRLAKLVSYSASRNLTARGLVKLTSVITSEAIFDSKGVNLANTRIIWNDSNNTDWKEQFFLVTNRLLEQEFGTVLPNDRVQVDDVLFELYTLKNVPSTNGVIPYSANINGQATQMELVPSALDDLGPYERRPEQDSKFSILYGSDGIGDSSDTTGFFIFTKQGTLGRVRHTYDGITPNQFTDILTENINDTDVWVNQINPDTGSTLDTVNFDATGRNLGTAGEWDAVDTTSAQNILFNTNLQRNKYEIETLESDSIRIIFGDGDFSDIPSGTFDIWFRTSDINNVTVPKGAVAGKSAAFRYVDTGNKSQTLTFTYSLISSISNSAPSEDIESIRRLAPAVYYTQDRLVNGQDYNTFMLQDSTILKLRAFNRTYSGDSKYLAWHDPSDHYENVKLFGDDGSIYYKEDFLSVDVPNNSTSNQVVVDYMQPLLTSSDVIIFHESNGLPQPRRQFTPSERTQFTELIEEVDLAGGSGFPLNVAYIDETTNGYESINLGSTQSSTDIALLGTSTPGSYRFLITVDNDPTEVNIAITVSASDTFEDVIDSINAELTTNGLAATASFIDGDIFIFSNSTGFQSVITLINPSDQDPSLLNQSLFPNLVGYESLGEPVSGTTSPTWRAYKSTTILNSLHTFEVGLSGITWSLFYNSETLVAESPTTRFWFNNEGQSVVNNDTLNPSEDQFVILGANINRDRNGIQVDDKILSIVGGITDDTNPNIGLESLTQLHLITLDVNGDLVPDNVLLDDTFDMRVTGDTTTTTTDPVRTGFTIYTLPSTSPTDFTYLADFDEVAVFYAGNELQRGLDYFEVDVSGNSQPVGTSLTTLTVDDSIVLDVSELDFRKLDFIYFEREDESSPYIQVETTEEIKLTWKTGSNVIRRRGRSDYNFAWFHVTPRQHLVDPSTTNINDVYMITRGYYTDLRNWLNGATSIEPTVPTPFQLKSDYNYLLDNKMISDTAVLHSGSIKVLIGSKAVPELQAEIVVVRSTGTKLTDNEIKVQIVDIVRDFFDINEWEYGETFNFPELGTIIQAQLSSDVKSVVLVPEHSNHVFGDLYQVLAREDEIFQVHITVDDIEVTDFLNPDNMRQNVT